MKRYFLYLLVALFVISILLNIFVKVPEKTDYNKLNSIDVTSVYEEKYPDYKICMDRYRQIGDDKQKEICNNMLSYLKK